MAHRIAMCSSDFQILNSLLRQDTLEEENFFRFANTQIKFLTKFIVENENIKIG